MSQGIWYTRSLSQPSSTRVDIGYIGSLSNLFHRLPIGYSQGGFALYITPKLEYVTLHACFMVSALMQVICKIRAPPVPFSWIELVPT